MRLWHRFIQWRTEKFLKTLPPVATRGDGGAWLLAKFRDQRGRPFNPLSRDDRHDVDMALRRAVIRSLPNLFGAQV